VIINDPFRRISHGVKIEKRIKFRRQTFLYNYMIGCMFEITVDLTKLKLQFNFAEAPNVVFEKIRQILVILSNSPQIQTYNK
jgi:hypothetical protein